MKTLSFRVLVASLLLAAAGSVAAEGPRIEPVAFKPGADSAVITGKIRGDESILYQLNAREGQWLQVSLRPDNHSAHYNIHVPGREPGDEALFNSASGGNREYTGQLYKSGEYTVSVFLNRSAAGQGDVANYDIVFRITDQQPGRLPAEIPGSANPALPPSSATDDPWSGVSLAARPHAPLLERQGALPRDLARHPTVLAFLALQPDFLGLVTSVTAEFDAMENPAEVEVILTERGILDDDLLGVRHVVSLARNRDDEWRIIGYAAGELRRAHLR